MLARTTRSVATTEAGDQLLAQVGPALGDIRIAARFDAGIEIGEFIQRDMIAVRVSADLRAAIVASPAYFRTHPRPRQPQDLLRHRCIGGRLGTAGLYRWEFEKGGKRQAASGQPRQYVKLAFRAGRQLDGPASSLRNRAALK